MTAQTARHQTLDRDDLDEPGKTRDPTALAEPGKTTFDRTARDKPGKTPDQADGESRTVDVHEHDQALEQTISTLRRTPIFAALPLEALAPLAAEAQPRTCKRGDHLWVGGDEHTTVHLVIAGQVQVLCLTPDGRAGALDLLVAGDLFGLEALEHEPPIGSMARVLAAGTLVAGLPRRHVLRLLERYPAAAYQALLQAQRHALRLRERVEDLTCYPVKVRLARTLIRLAVEAEGPIVMTAVEDIAALIGASREEAGRALVPLQERRLVAYRPRRGIRIRDARGLARYASLDGLAGARAS